MKVRPQPTTDHGWNSGTMGTSSYRRRSNITILVILTLGAILASGIVALVLLLFSSQPAPRHTPPVSSPSPVAAASYDPYEAYWQMAPAGVPKLSREDARVQAYLGCGQDYPLGTVERVLAVAYRPTGICN